MNFRDMKSLNQNSDVGSSEWRWDSSFRSKVEPKGKKMSMNTRLQIPYLKAISINRNPTLRNWLISRKKLILKMIRYLKKLYQVHKKNIKNKKQSQQMRRLQKKPRSQRRKIIVKYSRINLLLQAFAISRRWRARCW